MIIDEPKLIGGLGEKVSNGGTQYYNQDRVYDSDGVAVAVATSFQPNYLIVGMRGRNPDNPSDRTPGIELEQRLEPNSEGICNTLTTVQKDKLVLENNKIEKVGQISNEGSQCGTVVSTEGLYPTISADCHGYANPHIAENYRIRKLTPRECFRLMNVEEEQFNRAAFEKNVFYLEGEEDKCNAKLKVVQEKFRHIDLETYVLCTTNSILNMEELEIIKQKCKIKKQDEKTQNVNIVIEQLAKSGLMECVTNTTKCTEFMGMRYLLIEKQNLHPHMDIIVQVKKDKENTEKYMKITTESNLPASKLYTILILLGQIIQSKIFGSTTPKVNIQGNIAITEVYENSILLKVSNLKMENISTRVSSTQLYKIAGNAIVVSVLCALFSQLNIQGIKTWNEQNNEERYKIVNKGCVRNSSYSSPKPCGV